MDIILCIAKTKQNTPNLQSAQYGPCTWRPKDFAFEIRKQKSENDAFAVFLRLFIENEKITYTKIWVHLTFLKFGCT